MENKENRNRGSDLIKMLKNSETMLGAAVGTAVLAACIYLHVQLQTEREQIQGHYNSEIVYSGGHE